MREGQRALRYLDFAIPKTYRFANILNSYGRHIIDVLYPHGHLDHGTNLSYVDIAVRGSRNFIGLQ